jgi:nicotinamidase-related amidase
MPQAKLHDWRIEPREYERQIARRGRKHAFAHVDPRRTALVVIDMISFFVEESAYCRGIVPTIIHLAGEVRRTGGTVAWVRPSGRHRHPALMAEFFGDETALLYRTSNGKRDIWPAFQIDAADLSIDKSLFSAFFPGSSPLPSLLEERGIDTVLITGTVTNICCESSARDAAALGLRVILVADANAARRDADHNAALHNIYRSFGDVRPTAEVVDLLRQGQLRA